MYNSMPYRGLSGLGFSLKPPAWLRTAVGQIVGGTTVSVPSVTVPLPGGGSVTTPGTKPTIGQQLQTGVNTVPGGWVTVAAVALGAMYVLPKLMGRRGR